jgi:hypothetical protein
MRRVLPWLFLSIFVCGCPGRAVETEPNAKTAPLAGAAAPTGSGAPTPPTTTTSAPKATLNAALVGSWTHSRDIGEQRVYVRDPIGLPPARFRDEFDLLSDGSATRLILAANDGHTSQPTQWWTVGTTLVIGTEWFTVVEVSRSELNLRASGSGCRGRPGAEALTSPDRCEMTEFTCSETEQIHRSACGCGCVPRPSTTMAVQSSCPPAEPVGHVQCSVEGAKCQYHRRQGNAEAEITAPVDCECKDADGNGAPFWQCLASHP